MNETKEQLIRSLKEAYSLRRKMHVNNIKKLRNLLKLKSSQVIQDQLTKEKDLRKQCDIAWSYLNNVVIGKTEYDQSEYDRLVNHFKAS